MKGKVIALWGRGDIGKSEAVKKAYELLTSKYKNTTPDEYPKPIFEGDIMVVLTIKGVKIGIESQGDPGGRLSKSLSAFVNVKCKVIICATRTRGQTVDAVTALEKNNYEVIWIEQEIKSTKSEHKPSNLVMAKKLVKEAEKIINS